MKLLAIVGCYVVGAAMLLGTMLVDLVVHPAIEWMAILFLGYAVGVCLLLAGLLAEAVGREVTP